MLATENRTRSRIKRILAIALPVVGRQIRTIRVHGAILAALLGLVVSGFSQTTVSTGGIQGTVTDPSGALVTGAIVSITNTATGQTASVKTNSAGAYTFAFLKPADYVVRIEARSFKTTRLPITVIGCAPTPGAGVDCAISGINHGGVGATISDYAGFGLGSSSDMGGSNCFAALGYFSWLERCPVTGPRRKRNQASALSTPLAVGNSLLNTSAA